VAAEAASATLVFLSVSAVVAAVIELLYVVVLVFQVPVAVLRVVALVA